MKPTVRRTLPWLAMLCLTLACDRERKAEPATPADATRVVGAGQEPTTTAAKTDADTPPEATKPIPTKPVPPRAVVFYRTAPKYRVKLWALPEATAADPAAARDLHIVADEGGGSIDHGTGGPVLSRDGQWLAYLDDGRLHLARLDGSANHRITKHRGNVVTLMISGFAPDSTRLVFYQGDDQGDDPRPLPKGVVAGFYELVLADLTLVPQPSLEAFNTFTDDGRHVIFEQSGKLISFDLDTGATEQLQLAQGFYGFSQLVLLGERILYVQHLANGKSRVAIDALRGGKRIALSPEGKFAQYQWPNISLDGRRVTYTDETNLVVRSIDEDDTKTLMTCTQRHCDQAWDSATTVVVLDAGQLSRVSLDGTVTPLATDVHGFVLAGAPG
jgi:hypothetical protein